ncbi:MAG TPA: GNAT family N-acetyltransferase [Planctomycetota bacterium]|nr:GNAT family N-acetyltransferase [Planctomycetota bacterium]
MPESSAVVVRRARIEDVESMVLLWREMWDFHVPLDPRFEITASANLVMGKWFEDTIPNDRALLLVAEEKPGLLLGYCHAMIMENPPLVPRQYYGYVSELAVHERRRGIGTRLLDTAHAWFREKGMSHVEVVVSVRNAVGGTFWRRQGYTEFLERLRREL